MDVFTHIVHELGLTLCHLHGLPAISGKGLQGCHSLPGLIESPKLVVSSFPREICLQLQAAHAWSIENVIAPIHSILKRLVLHRSLDGIVQLVNVIALD